MMKKVLQFAFVCCIALFMSCSEEETQGTELEVAAQELAQDLSEYEGTPYGSFKGVFSTNDSQERGTIAIEIISDNLAKAQLNLVNGEVIELTGVPTRTSEGDLMVQLAASNAGFDFRVAQDGSHPTVSSAVFYDAPSAITTVKENTRGAIISSTGTWTGLSAAGATVTDTFSLIFASQADADGNSANITTMIMYNGADIGTTMGNTQSNCTPDDLGQTCDVTGATNGAGGITITWLGTHIALGVAGIEDCSQFDGTWSGPNGSAGTFSSDNACAYVCNGNLTTVAGGVASAESGDNNILSNATHTFTATSAGTGTIGTDADIDNVTIDINHTYDGDLEISLVSPLGTSLDLTSDNGGGGDNFTNTVFRNGGDDVTLGTAPFTGEFQPEGGSFTVFDGESISGNWNLVVTDDAGGDSGTLNSWSISFCDENMLGSFAPGGDSTATRSAMPEKEEDKKPNSKRNK